MQQKNPRVVLPTEKRQIYTQKRNETPHVGLQTQEMIYQRKERRNDSGHHVPSTTAHFYATSIPFAPTPTLSRRYHSRENECIERILCQIVCKKKIFFFLRKKGFSTWGCSCPTGTIDRMPTSMDAILPAHKVEYVGKPTPPSGLYWDLFSSSRSTRLVGGLVLGRLGGLSTALLGILSSGCVGYFEPCRVPRWNPASRLSVIIARAWLAFSKRS